MKSRLLALLLIGSFSALYLVGSDGLANSLYNQSPYDIHGVKPRFSNFSVPSLMLIDSRTEITETEIILGDLYEEIALLSNEIRLLKEMNESLERRISSIENRVN